MKAYRLIKPTVADLVDIDVPEPGPGEVLLKVAGAGVCHSDLHILHAEHWHPLPMTIGHEIAGHVESVGDGVTGWENGAPALVYLAWGCGLCRTCASGLENYCERFGREITPGPGLGYPGGMAEFVVSPARFLVPLGDLDPVEAAPLTDAALTPYHAIRLADDLLDSSATAVVIGVGGLGHMAVQILAATCAARIVAVDTDESKLELARSLGAAETVPSDKAATQTVLHMTGNRGVQVVFDFVGADPTLKLAGEIIAPFGRIVDVGLAAGKLSFPADSPPVGLPWGAGIVKPYGGTRADLHDVVALAKAGKISVTVERHPLADAAKVLQRLESGKVIGRAVLTP